MRPGAVVAVTGGARGIGLATGRAFANLGARVALGDIDATLAAEVAAALPTTAASSPAHLGLALDVRIEESCARFVDAVTARWGRVDVLVNCAGVAIPGDFVGGSAAEQDLQVDVNLLGVVRMMRHALPGMVDRRSGHIVNLASAVGRIPAPRAAIYGATKQAVVGLTESVRWETRRHGVRVTAVLPTVVSTEMAAGLRTPGLPVVSAVTVANAVVRVVRSAHPPAVTMVPRWLRIAALLDAVSPQWVRDRARTVIRLEDLAGNDGRRAYLARISRQLPAGERGDSAQVE